MKYKKKEKRGHAAPRPACCVVAIASNIKAHFISAFKL
jgi:hypothetical protein